MSLLHHKLPPSYRFAIAIHHGNIHSWRPVAYVGAGMLLPSLNFSLVLLHAQQVKATQLYIAVVPGVFKHKGNLVFCGVGVNGNWNDAYACIILLRGGYPIR